MNILEQLHNHNISHAVCVAEFTSRLDILEGKGGKDFFIVSKASELKKKRLVYTKFEHDDSYPGFMFLDFGRSDLSFFRKVVKEKYDKVLQSDSGRVYELKNNPFKSIKDGDQFKILFK